MTEAAAIVQRVWNYCNVLRDDGVSYGDYLEQLTYLLFLKMAEERAEIGWPNPIPEQYRWPTLVARRGWSWRIITGNCCGSWAAAPG